MTPSTWVALAAVILTLIGSIVTITAFVRGFKEDLLQTTLAYERKLTQMDAGLRAIMTEMGFYVRDNYVQNEVFHKMIDMAAAANENQFRALTETMNRLNDKLDVIQKEILQRA